MQARAGYVTPGRVDQHTTAQVGPHTKGRVERATWVPEARNIRARADPRTKGPADPHTMVLVGQQIRARVGHVTQARVGQPIKVLVDRAIQDLEELVKAALLSVSDGVRLAIV
jgi:hypothetical protein